MPRQQQRAARKTPTSPIPIRPAALTDALADLPTLPEKAFALAVTPTQGAKLLQIGYRQFYALLMAGEIKSFTIGRSRRVPVTAIEAFIQDRLQVDSQRYHTSA